MAKHPQLDREERVLMPRSAPPVGVPRPWTGARSAEERASRAARSRDERELATLAGQLGALERDIRAVRRATRRSVAPPGLGFPARCNHAAQRRDGERVRLRDGSQIVIRPVEPQDAAQLKAGFERLGAVSRYRRFLGPIDDLNARQLEYLTRVDHTSHEALGALDAATGEGVGIARYVRDPEDAGQAEVAIVVADAWQGRGVGTALCQRLLARARAAGIERITARMLVGNDAARRLIAHAADTVSEQRLPGTILVTARLRD